MTKFIPVTYHSKYFPDETVAAAARAVLQAQGYGSVWRAESQREAELIAVAALDAARQCEAILPPTGEDLRLRNDLVGALTAGGHYHGGDNHAITGTVTMLCNRVRELESAGEQLREQVRRLAKVVEMPEATRSDLIEAYTTNYRRTREENAALHARAEWLAGQYDALLIERQELQADKARLMAQMKARDNA